MRDGRLVAIGLVLLAGGIALWRLDPSLDLALHGLLRLDRADRWVQRVVWFTTLGGLAVMGPVALLVAAALWWRGRGADAAWLVATIVSGRLLVEGIKPIVHRVRPPVIDRLELVPSWSFPSSHSAGTMMTCLAFALLAGGGWPATILALLAALAIGWSRLALAVHWPSDVLAGWGFGMAWVGLAALWLRPGVQTGTLA